MNEKLVATIRKSFAGKPTRELKRILAEKNSGEWSEEAVFVATEILAGRPDEPETEKTQESAPAPTKKLGVFALSEDERASYRSKIKLLGYIYCGIGLLLFTIPIAMVWYQPDRNGLVGALIFSGLPVIFITIGRQLTKLNARWRNSGLFLSGLLLLAVPIGTVIGYFGFLWLGKRGEVLLDGNAASEAK
jgi:hypothetical protein